MRPRFLMMLITMPITVAGCDGSAPIASTSAARQALQASLDAWKAGKPASSLVGEKPSIEAVDFEWKSRKILKDYSIGEAEPGQGTRTFAASLTIGGESAPKSVHYMVIGVEPVRIFRDEDYHRAMNMDNAPAPSRKKR